MRTRAPLLLWLLLALLFSAGTGAAVKTAEEEKLSTEEEPEIGHTTDEIKEAKEEFVSIDTDSDGFITEGEILAMEEVPEREEIDEFFETYDVDKDGKVSFDEILQADKAMRDEEPPEEAST
uniref:EF-hand domain-containing protein n=1 Tax=Calcidiscus leptoporus TaxID=127549 RepID=A0A7S0NVC4_9EUKA|mmetsp:Transcript_26661/g.62229  ORF Transcript_26661/g.62229 Transcript_26661/m.62229 type:complete len:122 (+) Transcript_26661:45-410(+)